MFKEDPPLALQLNFVENLIKHEHPIKDILTSEEVSLATGVSTYQHLELGALRTPSKTCNEGC